MILAFWKMKRIGAVSEALVPTPTEERFCKNCKWSSRWLLGWDSALCKHPRALLSESQAEFLKRSITGGKRKKKYYLCQNMRSGTCGSQPILWERK